MLVRRLSDDHDMTFGKGLQNYATGEEAIVQNVTTRLLLQKGEWFLDTDAGVPYIDSIEVKPSNLVYTEALLKQTILDTEGVLEITSFSLDFNSVTRILSVSATVITEYNGNTLTIEVPLS